MKIAAGRIALLTVCALISGPLCLRGQEEASSPFQEKGAPPFALASGTMGVIQTMSYALGMLRRVNPGTNHAINGMLFIANGTISEPRPGGQWTEYKVPKAQVEMTYYTFHQGVVESPGTRWDYTLVDPSGHMQRKILVAAGNYAWDEDTPGGNATPAMDSLNERMARVWLTPDGLLWKALTPDGKGIVDGVKAIEESGKTILTVPVNGMPVKAVLGHFDYPEKVEGRVKDAVLGDVPIEFEYSDYKDIEGSYHIFVPAHIVEKLDGHTTSDLTVTEFHTNAYAVFPVPGNVRQAAK